MCQRDIVKARRREGRKCTCVIVHSWGSNGNGGKPLLLDGCPVRLPDIDVGKEESEGMMREEEGKGNSGGAEINKGGGCL